MAEHAPVAVIGAGITGLTAAAELSRNNIDCVLFEASRETGGMCRSRTMDGVVFDSGPHMLMINPHRECGRYLIKLLSGEGLYRRRYLFAVSDGTRYWQLPISPGEFLRYPSWARHDLLKAALRRPLGFSGSKSLRNHIERRTGGRTYSAVYAPLIESKLGRTGEELHENWWTRAPKPISSFSGAAELESDNGDLLSVFGKFFHDMMPFYSYPRGGIGRVKSLLEDRCRGRTVTRCGKISTGFSHDRITEIRTGVETIPVSAVVWTAPVNDFYEAMGETCPAPAPATSTRFVYAVYRVSRRRKRQHLYTYHHGENTLFNRVYYPSSIYREDTPENLEGLCFEVRISPETGLLSGDQLIETISRDAMRTGIIQGKLLSWDTEDLKNTSPLLSESYLERESTLFSAVNRFSNLVFAGRQGNYCNCLIPGAVEQGLHAAGNVMAQHAAD